MSDFVDVNVELELVLLTEVTVGVVIFAGAASTGLDFLASAETGLPPASLPDIFDASSMSKSMSVSGGVSSTNFSAFTNWLKG